MTLWKPRKQYTDWTPEQLKYEITKLKAEITEVRKARIDKLWPSYYNAQITAAKSSMDAMTQVLECGSIKQAEQTAQAEIASLKEFITELEEENELQDITINLGGK